MARAWRGHAKPGSARKQSAGTVRLPACLSVCLGMAACSQTFCWEWQPAAKHSAGNGSLQPNTLLGMANTLLRMAAYSQPTCWEWEPAAKQSAGDCSLQPTIGWEWQPAAKQSAGNGSLQPNNLLGMVSCSQAICGEWQEWQPVAKQYAGNGNLQSNNLLGMVACSQTICWEW
eukprot:gene11978-biopygen6416